MSRWVKDSGFKPSHLPPELQKVWQKHHDEMDRCWVEWMDGSMRHEALYNKHPRAQTRPWSETPRMTREIYLEDADAVLALIEGAAAG